ncbi:sigma-54-dependent transcriptional regulator [Alishewanella jeotgali]|uniref:Two component sigma-54 specific Fis family transcriptional regulator n=1 Tax=Alishewanella jeotgali KCTC 22429 TaxID=1129374 RepID=H3ZBH7_9ALTE|nr:sigma-54 dependent transcriptional regulator [Alishewanella jeotgali]EHR42291.1 two component sigma-54 specific Fis family transcriptional regulator [Alishewanella jeotgali KCTC 22429]
MSDLVVLVVEDDAGLREALCDTLLLAGYSPLAADCAEQALLLLKTQKVQLVVSDVQMGSVSGLNLLQTLNEHYPQLPVLLMTAYANVQDAVEAMRLGAIDYLSKPFSPEVLVSMVSRYVKTVPASANQPVVADPKSLALLQLAEKVARSEASVMILGPSGSGKEVLARYIHQQSSRSSAPFVAINCAAIPENMLEATLFGYEKGAYTGAVNACPGKFEQANGGTLLLDEVTEMPLNLQAKLLRVLQEREVERLGARKLIKLDIRILATSNRELRQAVSEGVLREDLYYRLNVFPLCWPALSERPGDILPLAEHLLTKYARQQERGIPVFTAAAKQRLLAHHWPGNVRELDNVMQRALILQSGNQLEANDILLESHPFVPSAASQDPETLAEESHFKSEIHQQEHKLILATMRACDNKRKEAAARLGISDRTLRYKLARMRDLGIEVA